MRLLFVAQRYGPEIPDETARYCRALARRLAAQGHDVKVLTTTAASETDCNDYEPGLSDDGDVAVHRLRLSRRHDPRFATPLEERVVWGRRPVPLYLQRDWIHARGPGIAELEPWLVERTTAFDVAAFFSYSDAITWLGLPIASASTVTILHPAAHGDPLLQLPIFRSTFELPRALAFLTHDEARLVTTECRPRSPSQVIGVGAELPGDTSLGTAFRSRHGLDNRPFLLHAGRTDRSSGVAELASFFAAYKERRPTSTVLALANSGGDALPSHPDVIPVTFASDAERDEAIGAALAVVQPSYYATHSHVILEAWGRETPVLVQGRCDMLHGAVMQAGGGLPYSGCAEFSAAVDMLSDTPGLARRLGYAGRSHVEREHAWPTVLASYERLLARTRP